MNRTFKKSLLATVVFTTTISAAVTFGQSTNPEATTSDFSTSKNIIVENVHLPEEQREYNYIYDITGESKNVDETLIGIETSFNSIETSLTPEVFFTEGGVDWPSIFDTDGSTPPTWDDLTDADGDGYLIDDLYEMLLYWKGIIDDPTGNQAIIDQWMNDNFDMTAPGFGDFTNITDIEKVPNSPLGQAVQSLYSVFEPFYSAEVNTEKDPTDNTTPLWQTLDKDALTATDIHPLSNNWADWTRFPNEAFYFLEESATITSEEEWKATSMAAVYGQSQGVWLEHLDLPGEIDSSTVTIDQIPLLDIEAIKASYDDGKVWGHITLPRVTIQLDEITWTDIETVDSIYTFNAFDGIDNGGNLENWIVSLNGGAGFPTAPFATDIVKNDIMTTMDAKIKAAVDSVIDPITFPEINEMVYNNLVTALFDPIDAFSTTLDGLVNTYITKVAEIETKINELNAKIESVNAAVNNFNTVTVPTFNRRIKNLNFKINEAEININAFIDQVNAGAADWQAIEALLEALNAKIVDINTSIDAINLVIEGAIALANSYIQENFGKLNDWVDLTNLTFTLVYESINYQIWFYEGMAILNEAGQFDNKPDVTQNFNRYQETIGRNGTAYSPGGDNILGTTDDEVLPNPFTEISITDSTGTVIPVDTTNPRFTETPTETYSLTYTVAARQDGDYAAFDADGIKIYDQNGTQLTYTVDAGTLVDDTPTNYDIYEYQYTISGLSAGQEYFFNMEVNNDPVNAALDAELYEGYTIQVNENPVVYYMPNTVTLDIATPVISEVVANATWRVEEDDKYWNVEEDDIQYTISQAGTDVTTTLAPNITTSYIDNDGSVGYGEYTIDIARGLLPETEYTIEIFLRSYDSDDGFEGIETDGDYVSMGTWTFVTEPWIAPQAPEVLIVDETDFLPETAEKKHQFKIGYQITIPGADELTGQDVTEITSIDIYTKYNQPVDLGGSGTYTDWETTPHITHVPINNGTHGQTSDVYDSGTFHLGDEDYYETNTDDQPTIQENNTELFLGTEYTIRVDVTYQGLNASEIHGPGTNQAVVSSNELVLTTEGLNPALPPTFDATEGLVFLEGQQTTDSITLSFNFVDPMTPDANTTNTIIEAVWFSYGTSSTSLTEELRVGDPNLSITWDTTAPIEDDNNTADVIYSGTATISGLAPNQDYWFQMHLDSNAIPDISSDPLLDKITVDSEIVQGKTWKLDALLPEWDPVAPLEFVTATENTLVFTYDFYVPENDLTHKNTFFDGVKVEMGTSSGALTLIEEGVNYNITAFESGVDASDTGMPDAKNGNFSGQIEFIGLDPNTTYYLRAGIKSHWYDDDYPGSLPPDTDLPEVWTLEKSASTLKLPHRDPWFDEDPTSETFGGLSFVDSFVVNTTGENTIDTTLSYKFYMPPTDEDYFDTYYTSYDLYAKSNYVGESYWKVPSSNITINAAKTNELTTGIPEHSMTVYAADGTAYTTTVTSGMEYSGQITIHDLNPEENYDVKLVVQSESENTLTVDGTPDGPLIDPVADIETEVNFDTSMLPPRKPFFGLESNPDDGLLFTEEEYWTDTTIAFTFDFTLPTKLHGYEPGLLYGLNVYLGTTEGSLSLKTEGVDYDVEWEKGGEASSEVSGAFEAALYTGTVHFYNLTPNTRYFVQLGIESNYYEGTDPTNLVEVRSPVVSGKTSSVPAVAPEILSTAVDFNKDKGRFVLSMDVQTFNGINSGETDPGLQVADTLLTKIHVGNLYQDADGNFQDITDGSVITPDNIAANIDKAKTVDKDHYIGTGGYTINAADNGAGVETVSYTVNLLTSKIPFETTVDDMFVSVDWKDDETSYENQTGTVKAYVEPFTTPDIQLITPIFTSALVTETAQRWANLSYNISLLDPDVNPNPDADGNTWFIDEPEFWQSETIIDRIYVKGNPGEDQTVHPDSGTRRTSKEDPVTPPDPDSLPVMYYDSEADESFNGSMFGEIVLTGLMDNTLYSGLTIYADYSSWRPSEVGMIGKDPLRQDTIAMVIPDFQTPPLEFLTPEVDNEEKEWETLTPEVDVPEPEVILPPEVTDPGNQEGMIKNPQRFIWILILILFTGITVGAVLYPMLKG